MNRVLMCSAWVVLSILLTGCGEEDQTTLSGEITLDGEPVKSGFILVYGPVNGWVSENIQDGKYEVISPPLGEVTLVVSDGSPRPPGWKPDSAHYRPGSIPPQYTAKEVSPLKTEVKEGSNTFDVRMESPK